MKIAIIPARGGSKRIPKKNIKLFNGKPMIAWSIEAAKNSLCFDHIVVSTDSLEVKEIAESLGAEVPFIRPKSLSDDFTGTIPVIAHAITACEDIYQSDVLHACCIYATAPFIASEDIKEAFERLVIQNCEYVFSITKYPFPIQRAIVLTEMNRVAMLQPDMFNTRSQDLQETYHDAGQFYWGTSSAWKSHKILFAPYAHGYYIPTNRVQDIDTLEDWDRAEWLHKYLLSCSRTLF